MLSTINICSLYQFKLSKLDTCSQLKSNNLSVVYFISLINLVIFHIRAVENKDKGTGAVEITDESNRAAENKYIWTEAVEYTDDGTLAGTGAVKYTYMPPFYWSSYIFRFNSRSLVRMCPVDSGTTAADPVTQLARAAPTLLLESWLFLL